MTFCKACGTPVEGQFCGRCGAAVPVAASTATAGPTTMGGSVGAAYAPQPQPAAAAQYAAAQPPPQQYQSAPNAVAGIGDNVAAGLCYLVPVLVPILFLVMAPYNQRREIRFHAFHSIFFGVACMALSIALMFATGLLGSIPVIGFMIGVLLNMALGIGSLIVWLMMLIKAFNGQRFPLPVIGPLAEQQAGTL